MLFITLKLHKIPSYLSWMHSCSLFPVISWLMSSQLPICLFTYFSCFGLAWSWLPLLLRQSFLQRILFVWGWLWTFQSSTMRFWTLLKGSSFSQYIESSQNSIIYHSATDLTIFQGMPSCEASFWWSYFWAWYLEWGFIQG